MRAFLFSLLLLAASLCNPVSAARAAETDFVITVKAQDAKFIGTAAGGAQIVVRDRRTGDILTSGVTYGETGDTKTIVTDDRKRDAVLTAEGTAKYAFTLEHWEPLPVTITVSAPLGQPQAMVSVSQDMTFLPGKDYASGNGILIEVPGFAVDVVSPTPNQKFKTNADIPVTVEANVMKLCGCLVAADTAWPPERYEVEVWVYKDNLFITSVKMNYANEPGLYTANLKMPTAGIYRLMVTAFDPQTKETGLDTTTVIFEE